MDAAMLTAIGAVLASPVAAAAAVYGTRATRRSTREGTVITGYDTLTARLVVERDKAEADQAAAEAARAAAEAKVHALEAENQSLRTQVRALGGTP